MSLKKCKTPPINKICNEKTGRNVFITGKIGKKILSERIKKKHILKNLQNYLNLL